MLRHMRTTIRLPDDLYQAVRLSATSSGRTVTSFIEEALREALIRKSQRDQQTATFKVQPLQGDGLRPGVDLADSQALLDVMEDE